jgi:type I restriction enzyme S subunit
VTEALPKGWACARLSDIAEVNPALAKEVSDDTYVSFVPMAAVEEMSGRLDPSATRPWSEVRKGFTKFQEGDIVLAKITPSMENGKAALALGLHNGVAAGTTELHIVRPRTGIDGHFLLHYLLQESFRRRARARMTGTAGQLRVPEAFLEEEALPVAPPCEQRRIVEAVETYVSRLDAAVESLKRAQARLKAYRASVLKAAVEGRLVPTEAELARAENRDYEPASVLLRKTSSERRRRWEEAELARLNATGKSPQDERWKAKYEEETAPDERELPSLPEGWCWTNLGMIKDFSLYGPRFSSDDYSNNGVLVLRTSDISEAGKVDLTTPPRLQLSEDELAKYEARRGDLLITRTGSLGTLAVLDDDVRAIPGAYLIQYRLLAPLETVWFCFHFLKSPGAQAMLVSGGRGVGRPNLNAPTIEALPIPFPPIDEQARINEELRRLFSISDGVLAQIRSQLRRCTRLRQSVLAWAFEGKLVDQDPTDEPAENLLERIRAERELSKPAKPKRARKSKAAR